MTDLDQMDLFQKETQFTSLQEVILVNRCQPQVREKVKKIQDTSFQNIYDLLKNSVQFTPLEKMLADILDSVSTRYSRTWSILTTESGALVWKHRVSEHGIGDNESGGSQRIFPTPTSVETEHPQAELDHLGRRKASDGIGTSHSLNLADTVRIFPTPRSSGQEKPETLIKRKGLKKAMQHNLTAVVHFFPTPTANEDACGTPDGKMQKMLGNHPEVRNQGKGTLNPDWTEWLMGFPIGYTNLEELEEPQQSKKTEPKD